ncbi:MAG TPA: hypothetical protein VKV26_08880 [Dehalococcoidia bacterium]|nr:hypothetical protein [Dehalococcoidia bacterium]
MAESTRQRLNDGAAKLVQAVQLTEQAQALLGAAGDGSAQQLRLGAVLALPGVQANAAGALHAAAKLADAGALIATAAADFAAVSRGCLATAVQYHGLAQALLQQAAPFAPPSPSLAELHQQASEQRD